MIGRGENTIAIPGFRTLTQVEENAATWASGRWRMPRAEIATLLAPFRGE